MRGRLAPLALGVACCVGLSACVSTPPEAKDAAAQLRRVPGVASVDVRTAVVDDSFQPTTTFTVAAQPDPDAATLDGILSGYGGLHVPGNHGLVLTWREGSSPRELVAVEGPRAPIGATLAGLPPRGVRARLAGDGITDTVYLTLACPEAQTATCVRELGPRAAVMSVQVPESNEALPPTLPAKRGVTYTGSARELAASLAPQVYAAAPDATRITIKLDDDSGVDVAWGNWTRTATADPQHALRAAREPARAVAAVVHSQSRALGIRYWVDGQLSTVPDHGCPPAHDELGTDVSHWLTTTGKRASWAPRC